MQRNDDNFFATTSVAHRLRPTGPAVVTMRLTTERLGTIAQARHGPN
jgi:hypothetical protein